MILNQGIRVIGIDAWGFDLPLKYAAQTARDRKDRSFFWQAHYVGIKHEYCHIEQLTNLDKLPPRDFTIACFPVKIKGGSAGWCRVVAFLAD